jgi:chromosome segregation ATPase
MYTAVKSYAPMDELTNNPVVLSSIVSGVTALLVVVFQRVSDWKKTRDANTHSSTLLTVQTESSERIAMSSLFAARVSSLEETMARMHASIASLQVENSRLAGHDAFQDREIERLTTHNASLQLEIEMLQEHNKILTAELQEVKKERDLYKDTLNEMKDTVHSLAENSQVI